MSADTEKPALIPEPLWLGTLRKVMNWAAVIGAALFALVFFAGVALVSSFGFWDGIAKKHFPAVVGLPSAALAALFIVIILRTVAGPIEFKLGPIEFKGASGPILMWLACLMAITSAIAWLWPLTYSY